MSGHSKWATIKRKKGDTDARKGKIFTKLVREITTAARMGGADVTGNPRLRAAVQAAKAARMPADNIERGIAKGSGTLDGPQVEDVFYEGYGPGGVAIYVLAQTDNRNRTSGDVRAVFSKNEGNMGALGSVAYLFKNRGQFVFDAPAVDEDALMQVALEVGADDVRRQDANWVVDCDYKQFSAVMDGLDAAKLVYERADLTWVADTLMRVDQDVAARVDRLIERLEDLDDVQKVYANFDPLAAAT